VTGFGGDVSFGAASGDDHRAVTEDELGAMVADAKTFFESERMAEPPARLGHVVVRQHGDHCGTRH